MIKLIPIIILGILPLAVFTGPNSQELFFQGYTDIGVQGEIGPLFAGGSVLTTVTKSEENMTFMPVQASYHLWAGLKWKDFSFGADYMCSHPVSPFQRFFGTKSEIDLNRLSLEVRYDPR
jgi:hypothetical protein